MKLVPTTKTLAIGTVVAILSMFSAVAQAAIDSAVTTELGTAKTDVMALGALVFGIALGIVLYKWFKRAL